MLATNTTCPVPISQVCNVRSCLLTDFDGMGVFSASDQSSPYGINAEMKSAELILTSLHFLACKSDFFYTFIIFNNYKSIYLNYPF